MKNKKISYFVTIAMLGAIATLLMLFEFPLPFIAPFFYELNFSEVPVLIGAFALGPIAGVLIEAVKILLNLLLNGTDTACIGELSNFIIGAIFVFPAAFIYKRNKTKATAVLGLIIGGFCTVVLGCIINAYIMLPVYGKAFNLPIENIVSMGSKIWPAIDSLPEFVLLCVAPFNIIKVIAVSVITVLIYKPMHSLITKIEK